MALNLKTAFAYGGKGPLDWQLRQHFEKDVRWFQGRSEAR